MPRPVGKIDLALVGNSIYQNETAGVRVENNTRLTAEGNQIHDNRGAGIIVHESVVPPELDIYRNKISFNNGQGIQIVNGITGRIGISNNWIYGNHLSGIGCGQFNSPISSLDNIKIMHNRREIGRDILRASHSYFGRIGSIGKTSAPTTKGKADGRNCFNNDRFATIKSNVCWVGGVRFTIYLNHTTVSRADIHGQPEG